MSRDHERLKKVAFVTVGATAPFEELIKAVLEPEFLQALEEKEYTTLVCQTGASINTFNQLKPKDSEFGMKYAGFQFNKKGLGDEMRQVKAKEGDSREGVVITAAGKRLSCVRKDARYRSRVTNNATRSWDHPRRASHWCPPHCCCQ